MATRTKKAKRILALQEQLLRSSEWKLSGIRTQMAENEATRDALISTLSDEMLGPLLVDVAARRLRSVALARNQLALGEAKQTARVLEESRQVKRAERTLDTVRRADAHARERQDFNELLDAVAAKSTTPADPADGDASLPPA